MLPKHAPPSVRPDSTPSVYVAAPDEEVPATVRDRRPWHEDDDEAPTLRDGTRTPRPPLHRGRESAASARTS